jgi:SAM-dependent methyltransferase
MPTIEAPSPGVPPRMRQTPAHSVVNHDLLALMPTAARRVVEVGCMHGALARAYRQRNLGVHYTGIDIDPDYARIARQACHLALDGDIEQFSAQAFSALFPSDCWVFGDCLEHLRDPWRLLRRIREHISEDGCLLTCIPNAQHWSVQMRLATGLFRYEDSGLLDRTHIRWFTRVTMIELFTQNGWRVENGVSRRLPQQAPEALLQGIAAIAQAGGADPVQAVDDAQVFQYLFKVVPA